MHDICRGCYNNNECKYINEQWENCSLTLNEHCARDFKKDCDEIYKELKPIMKRLMKTNFTLQRTFRKEWNVIINVANDIK